MPDSTQLLVLAMIPVASLLVPLSMVLSLWLMVRLRQRHRQVWSHRAGLHLLLGWEFQRLVFDDELVRLRDPLVRRLVYWLRATYAVIGSLIAITFLWAVRPSR